MGRLAGQHQLGEDGVRPSLELRGLHCTRSDATGPRGTRAEWDPVSDANVSVHHDPNGHLFPDGSTIDPHYGVDVPGAPTVHHTYPSSIDPSLNR